MRRSSRVVFEHKEIIGEVYHCKDSDIDLKQGSCSSIEVMCKMPVPSLEHQQNVAQHPGILEHSNTEQILHLEQELHKNKAESLELERENQNLESQAQALQEQLRKIDEVELSLGSMKVRHISGFIAA